MRYVVLLALAIAVALSGRSLILDRAGTTLRGIGPGTHRLRASDPEIELLPDHVTVGTEPVEVELRLRRRGPR